MSETTKKLFAIREVLDMLAEKKQTAKVIKTRAVLMSIANELIAEECGDAEL